MADESKNQNNGQGNDTPSPKTFTQAEVDAMIGERLTRERAKFADYEAIKAKAAQFDAQEEAAKSELQKAQDNAAKLQAELDKMKKGNAARDARDKVAAETGIPAHLLSGETEEACKAQAAKLLEWRGDKKNYPNGTKDGGEVPPAAGGKTRDQFEEWFKSVTK